MILFLIIPFQEIRCVCLLKQPQRKKGEFHIHAPIQVLLNVLMNVLHSLRKSNKMFGKPRILFFPSTRLISSIKRYHSTKLSILCFL